jgi:PAS domain S-box-containing protein
VVAREDLGARAHGARIVPERFYRAAFEQAPDCIFGLDNEGRITAVNPPGCELLGYSCDELLGREVRDFVPPEDLAAAPLRFDELRAQGAITSERRLRCRDGRLAVLAFTVRTLPDGSFVGVGRDVGQRSAIEDRLRRSEKMMADVLSFLPDATFAIDTHGGVIAWNRAMEVMTGVPAGDMLGRGDHAYAIPLYGERRPILIDFVATERGRIEAYYPDVRRIGELLVAETFVPLAYEGRGADLWGIAAPLFNDADERIGAIESIRDVTEHRRDREALRASDALLRATLDAAADGILAVDERGAVVHRNRRFAELWRIPPELLAAGDDERLLAFVLEQLEDPGAFLAKVRALYGSPDEDRDVIRFKDGRIYERSSCPMIEGGKLCGRVWSFRDVTARLRAEQAVQESERRYRTLFESAADAIFLMRDGRFADCNSRTLEMFGCTREQIVGAAPAGFSPPRQRDGRDSVEKAAEKIAAALAGEHQVFEWLHSRADGTVFDAEVGLTRVELTLGPHLLATVRDTTERQRAQEERLQLQRRLLHSQKLESLGVLAGGIAHDFNNLLMAMQGNLELALAGQARGSSACSRIEDAMRALHRAADLTHQMLAYSGRGRFTARRLSLSDLVDENAHLFRASIARTTVLDLHLDPDLPPVEADAGQLQQVVMNLITNASEAIGGSPGTIRLSTGVADCSDADLGRSRLDEKPAPGRFAYVEVADSGCGMDAETQRRMFDPFFTTKLTGRGLGMAAAQGIVRGHQGAMFLDSTPGGGTTIRVLFPLTAGPAEEGVPPVLGPVEAMPEASRMQGVVLLVDDEEIVRGSSGLMLEYLGFTVVTAADGEEAVEVMRRRADEIVAVLLDLTMPRMDGVTALDRILEIRPDARVILCSGYDEPDTRKRLAGRLAGFLAKPFDLQDLESVLSRVLQHSA